MAQAAVRKVPRRTASTSPATPLYPPSWVDRLMAVVQRVPIPYGLTYLALIGLEALVLHMLGWIDGSLERYTFHRIALLFPLWTWGPLAAMTYLDEVARHSLRDFGALLPRRASQLPRLEHELTTLPPRAVLWSGVFWLAGFAATMFIGMPVVVRQMRFGPVMTAGSWVVGLLAYVVGSPIYYHTIRQLRLVSSILGMVARVNLFRLEPVYAFARLTAQTGVVWLLLAGATLIAFPIDLVNVVAVALYITQVVFALGAFVLPLWNVHQRLVAEKRRLLAEVNRRVERTIGRLHKALDGGDLPGAREVDLALGGLVTERKLLVDIPTWPWSASTLSGFVSAMLLPIALFLIQLAIRRWLGI